MEVSVAMPDDPLLCRQLAFNPRFHDTQSLIDELHEGIIDHRQLNEIAHTIQQTIHASETLQSYVVALWQAVRKPAAAGIHIDGVDMDRLVTAGASPRGISYLVRTARVRAWLEGRDMLIPEDIRAVFGPVMGHRLFLDPIYELQREQLLPLLLQGVFQHVPTP
ncbi:MAG: AAA family ATPase [Parahaliea sp.]